MGLRNKLNPEVSSADCRSTQVSAKCSVSKQEYDTHSGAESVFGHGGGVLSPDRYVAGYDAVFVVKSCRK